MFVITIASLPLTVTVPLLVTIVNPFKLVLITVTVWLPLIHLETENPESLYTKWLQQLYKLAMLTIYKWPII